jgi:ankyrin repeat protein
LNEPSAGEFVFEPYKLKLILSWEQQQQIVAEFKAATVRVTGQVLDLKRTVAAFYLFQCHLEEFGVVLDSAEATEWLRQAAADDESHEDADYQAQAWLWRLSRVFGVELNIPKKRLEDLLRISVFRGHRTGLEDLSQLAFHIRSYDNASLEALYWDAQRLFLKFTGAVGMAYFLPHRMTIKFNLHNLVELDAQLRLHLGENYEKSLKAGAISENRSGNTPQASTDTSEDVNDFDNIYLNERGHGLLHFAAANGNIKALRHLVEKYKCNIDLPNQHVDETPLICACQGGNLDCAIYLLEKGANPNGSRFSHEGPLHWMCSFPLPEIEVLVPTLIAEGADIELYGGGMRHDVRGIRADWEHNFDIIVTPLGRAVLMRNADAVEVLLELGADPLAGAGNWHQGQMTGLHMQKELSVSCPLELAAVLTLPRILEKMLAHIDRSNREKQMRVIDEVAMLDLAHNKRVTKFNTLTLQSRLVRCGVTYVTDLRTTLFTLSRRAQKWHEARDNEEINKERSEVLCKEISLGNVDIVQCLLDLNYPVDGCRGFKPIEQAISLNHENIFQLLLKHKVDLTSIRTTPDGSQLSLLHLCASRPKQSRPGRTIVDHLISAGLPLDTKDGKRSPLVLAILNQNFDVATALLENRADVNAPYQIESLGSDEHFRESEVRTVTILAELLVQHTAGSLESLRFLFDKKPGGSLHRPDFIVDKTRNLSAFHILAESQQYTETAQITPQILNLCGQAYSEPSCINYVHPILGSPLYYAASVGNLAVASLLLSKGADVSSLAGPDLTLSVHSLLRTEGSWTALWAAILRYDEEIQNLVAFPPSDPLDLKPDSRLLANLESIIEKLFERDDDQLARHAWKRLVQRKGGLTKKHNDAVSARMKKRSGYQATKDDRPVELWMLEDSEGEVNKVDKKVAELSGKEWVTDELRKYFPTGL